MKKIMILMIVLLLVPTIMAADWDNWDFKQSETFDGKQIPGDKILSEYPPLKIDNLFGLGKELMEGYISKHDFECITECESVMQIKMHEKGALVDAVRFYDIDTDNLESISHKFYIEGVGDVDVWGSVCRKEGMIHPNGSQQEYCEWKVVGTEKASVWQEYVVGTEVPVGTYQLRITGTKEAAANIDWQIENNGVWLTQWAAWGNISAGDDSEVLLNEPVDGNESEVSTITFNCFANVTGGDGLSNISLWHNGSGTFELNQTDTFGETVDWSHGNDDANNSYSDISDTSWRAQLITIAGGGTISYVNATFWTQAGTPGTCYVWITANTADPDSGVLGIGTFSGNGITTWTNMTIDIVPDVTINASQHAIGFNCSAANLRVAVQSSGSYGGGDIRWSADSGSSWNNAANQDMIFRIGQASSSTYGNGSWTATIGEPTLWSCQGCDDAGDCGFALENRTVSLDTTPPDLTLLSPTNTTYTETYATSNSTQVNLSWSTDATAQSCWYAMDNNGSNVSVTCTDNETIFNTTFGNHGFEFWVNDSLNNVNSSSEDATYEYVLYEVDEGYNLYTNEMKNETFNISLLYGSGYTDISANLVHNSTSYIGTGSGSSPYNFTRTIDMPATYGQVNKTFYWDILLTNATGIFNFSSTSRTQQINETVFIACNATYPYHLVNFTMFREDTRAAISTNFESTFTYYIGTGTSSKNYSLDTAGTNQSFCSDIDETFYVESIINLDNDTFFEERTYEFDTSYNSTTTHTPLFMLPDGNGTSVIIQLRDSGLVPLENYIVEIERYYPETNEYELVVSQETDIYGQTVARLVEDTVKYRFTFKDSGGTTQKTTGDMLIACRATPCILPFVIEDDTDDFDRFGNLTDYDWSLSFNNVTNIFTFTWNDVSGVSATNWLEVKRYLWNGTTTVCNVTSTNASGSLTCSVGTSKAKYQAQVFRQVGSGEWRRIAILSAEVGQIWDTFGIEGMIWSFFLLMTCLVIGYWKPPVGFITFGLGIVLLGYMGIISLAPAIIIAFLVIIGLAAWAWRG